MQDEVCKSVDKILSDIKNYGDDALIKYTNKFDSQNISKENICVSREEIENAYKTVDKKFLDVLRRAAENIMFFHEKQKRNSWIVTKENGVILGQKVMALERVGVYVPGGTAAYPSSVLMNVIPAKIAGVKDIVMVTPPLKDGSINSNILVAADIAGVSKIYKIGGAQAVGALAFGTDIIDKVDKVVGPGNVFVAEAKKSVFGYVGIDMIAGPSEILILADGSANPKYIAADLMSQAEHDKLASAILITDSEELSEKVTIELQRQVKTLSRKNIILESLKNYGLIIVTDNIENGIRLSNIIAPEHLELCVREPFSILESIKNAGSIFMGNFAPEPLGDYIAGPNHVLPTSGTARFFSPLSVDDFIKKSSFTYYTRKSFSKVGNDIIKFADIEGLTAHANSVKVRLK
ncbi:histidinol dehydrogenase [Clostridium fermenticellae]|uniref:Histidinol dehydrogenase n=2 Tax=Clostridium fermenticellae TaxID=2068654 RepID=A0A386H748_9CLOT|nr:histidinol dehydrogenase [Clostridium fermenticellae]